MKRFEREGSVDAAGARAPDGWNALRTGFPIAATFTSVTTSLESEIPRTFAARATWRF